MRRMGASRGHGQYPAPPQSCTSIGTQSRIISPEAAHRFLSILCVGPPGLADFALHCYRGLRPRQWVYLPSGLRTTGAYAAWWQSI